MIDGGEGKLETGSRQLSWQNTILVFKLEEQKSVSVGILFNSEE